MQCHRCVGANAQDDIRRQRDQFHRRSANAVSIRRFRPTLHPAPSSPCINVAAEFGIGCPRPGRSVCRTRRPHLRLGFHPDDTTPIPRPSRYYGRRQNSLVQHLRQENHRAETQPTLPGAPALVPGQIDKSVLTIAEPRRLRDKAHLKFVASQPCLVCDRQPSDPHHLRFAQPRALALKVSDEFTVPLCRGHHRQLHQAGNEVTWWDGLSIDALEIAKGLWEHTRPKAVPSDTHVSGAGIDLIRQN